MIPPRPNTNDDFGQVVLKSRRLSLPCLLTPDGGNLEAAGTPCPSLEPVRLEGLASFPKQAAAMPESDRPALAVSSHSFLADELVYPLDADACRELRWAIC